MNPIEIGVRAGGGLRDYPVRIGLGIRVDVVPQLREVAPRVTRWVVISDENVAPLYGADVSRALERAGLGGDLLTVPAGEAHKNRSQWAALTDAMLDLGFGRDGGVVAVGGGVVGDLAGFVASTFMRGIPVVQMPTSLLAMIDASVGGKTGVDTDHGKNLVGAFHPPRLVLVDPETIATLPRSERSNGLAEALKHGAILDAPYGERIVAAADAVLDADPDAVLGVVHRSVELKAEVVSRDEREGGIREILNFGHTIGHAIEQTSGYALSHGRSIARGMLWEAALGEAIGTTRAGTEDHLRRWLTAAELPSERGPIDPAATVDLIRLDKKVRGGDPRVVLLSRVGEVDRDGDDWSRALGADELRANLERLAG
ncbi:MAG TPA: 3-dehydroquinate synthase [Longimicrobiales bacterium]|nr:3-dehydroquinate synthase [Longimicrobiales bacterium]